MLVARAIRYKRRHAVTSDESLTSPPPSWPPRKQIQIPATSHRIHVSKSLLSPPFPFLHSLPHDALGCLLNEMQECPFLHFFFFQKAFWFFLLVLFRFRPGLCPYRGPDYMTCKTKMQSPPSALGDYVVFSRRAPRRCCGRRYGGTRAAQQRGTKTRKTVSPNN